jgi:hypothetical protein
LVIALAVASYRSSLVAPAIAIEAVMAKEGCPDTVRLGKAAAVRLVLPNRVHGAIAAVEPDGAVVEDQVAISKKIHGVKDVLPVGPVSPDVTVGGPLPIALAPLTILLSLLVLASLVVQPLLVLASLIILLSLLVLASLVVQPLLVLASLIILLSLLVLSALVVQPLLVLSPLIVLLSLLVLATLVILLPLLVGLVLSLIVAILLTAQWLTSLGLAAHRLATRATVQIAVSSGILRLSNTRASQVAALTATLRVRCERKGHEAGEGCDRKSCSEFHLLLLGPSRLRRRAASAIGLNSRPCPKICVFTWSSGSGHLLGRRTHGRVVKDRLRLRLWLDMLFSEAGQSMSRSQ